MSLGQVIESRGYRDALRELEAIELWDMTHAEALTVDRVLRMVREALEKHRLG